MAKPEIKIRNGKVYCSNIKRPLAKVDSSRSLKSILHECKIEHIE